MVTPLGLWLTKSTVRKVSRGVEGGKLRQVEIPPRPACECSIFSGTSKPLNGQTSRFIWISPECINVCACVHAWESTWVPCAPWHGVLERVSERRSVHFRLAAGTHSALTNPKCLRCKWRRLRECGFLHSSFSEKSLLFIFTSSF